MDGSPAQLRYGRILRPHLDLLRPDVATKVHVAQSRQKKQHDQHSQMHQVEVGNAVNIRNYSLESTWLLGTIIQEAGPLYARVELEDGTVVRRHHDQVVSRPADVLPSGAAVPSASPFKQESVVSKVIVPDVNSPAVTFGDSESPTTSGDPDLGPTNPVR